MDKLRLLQSVKRSKIMDNLDTAETRLYLILLANSGENGDGKMLLTVIDGVLGEGFSMDRLKAACSKLAEYGLIEFRASSLKDVNDEDFRLAYHILEIKGGK